MDAAIRYVLYIFLSHLAWFKASTGQESWAAQTRPPNNNNKTSTSHYCYHEVRRKKTWAIFDFTHTYITCTYQIEVKE